MPQLAVLAISAWFAEKLEVVANAKKSRNPNKNPENPTLAKNSFCSWRKFGMGR
jgi:hypothetical protein